MSHSKAPTPAHQTRRDLRTEQRKRALRSDAKASYKALIAAARELFAERGPDGLTIVEVAKRAGLNRSTAYQHFRSREELSQCVAEEFANEVRDMLMEPRGLPDQIDFFVHYFEEHPAVARLWMFHLLADQGGPRRGWGTYLESLDTIAKSPRSQPGIDSEMLGVIGMTSALVWSLMARKRNENEEDAELETRRFATELKRLFLYGALKPEAWPELEAELQRESS